MPKKNKNTQIVTGVIRGASLVFLPTKLNAGKTETSYILGFPVTSWYKKVGVRKSHLPIEKASYSLMFRFALSFPDRVQRIIFPTPSEVLEKLKEISDKEVSLSDLGQLLVRDASSGSRWINQEKSFDSTTKRLARLFMIFSDAKSMKDWYKMTRKERRLRKSPPKSFALPKGLVTLDEDIVKNTSFENRLLVVGDFDHILDVFGFNIKDVHYYFGISMHKYHEMRNAPANTIIANPSLCLLIRLLLKFPHFLERLPTTTIVDVMKSIKRARLKYTMDEVAILTGNYTSIFYKWRTMEAGDDPSQVPMQSRILSHFKQEVDAGRIDEWIELVTIEAKARGVEPQDIWLGWQSDDGSEEEQEFSIY